MNKHIQLFSKFLSVIKIVLVALSGVFAIVILISIFNEEAFSSIIVQNAFLPKYGIGNFNYCPTCTEDSSLRLNEIGINMKIWMLLRGSLLLGLTFMIVSRMKEICTFATSISTFYKGSIQNFNRIAIYGFMIAVLSSFNFFSFNGESDIWVSFPFLPVAFSLFNLMLAEVFKEGLLLTEDTNSII